MAGPTRWGILSAGNISHDFVNAMKMMTDSENQVGAVAARNLTKASEFNQEFGNSIPRIYGSYEELAQDNNIDIVYIGNIHPGHFDAAMMMLNAGKNVLVEKPMAMNLQQVKQLTAKAKEKKLFLMEGFWSRFFPIYNHLRGELSSKSIGDVHTVMVNFGLGPITTARFVQRELGGGAILGIACYTVMFATMIFNEKPERICANGILSDEGVDIFSSTTLYYKGNRRAHLNAAMDQSYDKVATIYGTKGIITIPNFWHPEQMITPSKTYDCPVPMAQRRMNNQCSEGFMYEINCVRDCLVKGEKECPLMTLEHTHIINEVMDEMRRQIGVVYDADKE